MRKVYIFSLILFAVTTYCYAQNRYYIAPWAQKLFLGFNIIYDYEKLSTEDNFNITSNNVLFETTLGYDFGRIVPRIFFDIGLPLYGVVGFNNGDASLTETMDTRNLKLGLEVGIKPIKTQRFDLVIPLGILFCWTTYEQKNPSYTSGHPYDRIWDYNYINLFSGVNETVQLNRHFKIGLF